MSGRTRRVPDLAQARLPFVDSPKLAAGWPKEGTRADRALSLLLSGEGFNHPDFIGQCGSWRLAAAVFELRKLGWPIETVYTGRLRSGENPYPIATYWLNEECVNSVVGVRRPRTA